MGITASAGKVNAPLTPARPSWADMKKYYPDASIDTPQLYDELIKGGFVKLYENNSYANTCSVRMSYGLNRSGIKLGPAPSKGGSMKGGDGYTYWLRVSDLKSELSKRFKGFDEELDLTTIPSSLIEDDKALNEKFEVRVKEAQDYINKINSKNGIVVFEVQGWGDASGHFTLWDGTAKKLAYAPEHDSSDNSKYYFWLTYIAEGPEGKGARIIQVTKIKFWELK